VVARQEDEGGDGGYSMCTLGDQRLHTFIYCIATSFSLSRACVSLTADGS
jgi:hypothetical protein